MIDAEFDIKTLFNPIDLINLFIGLALVLAAVMSVYYMFYGGLSLIFSGGNDDKIKEAMGTIRYAIIGLIVTLLAVGFIYLLGNLTDIAVSDYINFERMFELLTGLADRIFNGPNTASMFD